MTTLPTLQALLERRVADGTVPGAVALVSHGDRVESVVAGHADTAGITPMTPDTLFRLASLTKPVVAAAVLTLLDEGALALEDPVSTWLPELADPVVVRTPQSPLEDVVPAARPITVFDVLTSRTAWSAPR
ncbi:putative protein [Streptomyces sp. enrichment culture]|uniref:serine hydrolase domain-containing protein n=1 Tax=Streptomyces sp. enrichment culture TaxID=1795815 RepID=UPI003F56A6B0